MHASSSTCAICTMMFHRTGSLSALKISVGGCGGMSSMVMMFPGQRGFAGHVPDGEVFQHYRSFGYASHFCEQTLAILIVEQSASLTFANASRCYVMERGRIVISGDSPSMCLVLTL